MKKGLIIKYSVSPPPLLLPILYFIFLHMYLHFFQQKILDFYMYFAYFCELSLLSYWCLRHLWIQYNFNNSVNLFTAFSKQMIKILEGKHYFTLNSFYSLKFLVLQPLFNLFNIFLFSFMKSQGHTCIHTDKSKQSYLLIIHFNIYSILIILHLIMLEIVQ